MMLDPWIRVLLLLGIWLFLAGILAWGVCRWFKIQRALDERDRRESQITRLLDPKHKL